MTKTNISDLISQVNEEKLRLRFLSHVKQLSNCWEWQATKSKFGYGKFSIKTKHVLAHRVSYELFKGEIPNDLTIDHLCRNKGCVNPEHLEPVSHKENTLRGNNIAAQNARKTKCKNGHPLSGDNLRLKHKDNGGNERICIICNRKEQRLRYLKHKNREVTP